MEKPNIFLNQSSSDSYYEYEEEDQRKEQRKISLRSKLDEIESLNDFKKLSRKEKIIEIQKAKKHFASFFESISKIDQNEFSTYKQELLDHIKGLKDIPTMKTIESIYEQYSSNEKFRKNYKNKNWNLYELKVYAFALICFCCIERKSVNEFNDNVWKKISQMFATKSAETCKNKYTALLRCHPTIISWSKEEDEFLKKLISQHKKKRHPRIRWSDIAFRINALFPNASRVGKHCRERWLNHLDPKLKKGSWKIDEDLIILQKTLDYGKKWAKIARDLSGRNENAVKNRFISLTKNLKKNKKMKYFATLKDPYFMEGVKSKINELNLKIKDETLGKMKIKQEKAEAAPKENPLNPIKKEFQESLNSVQNDTTKNLQPENPNFFMNNYNNFLFFNFFNQNPFDYVSNRNSSLNSNIELEFKNFLAQKNPDENLLKLNNELFAGPPRNLFDLFPIMPNPFFSSNIFNLPQSFPDIVPNNHSREGNIEIENEGKTNKSI